MNDTVWRTSLRGVVVAKGNGGMCTEEEIGWSTKVTAERSLKPSGNEVMQT